MAPTDHLARTTPRRTNIAPGIFNIDHMLNATECAALIARAQAQGFEAAPIITANGTRAQPDTRNNDRCVFDDTALAASLWQRACGAIPPVLNGRTAVGLNERYRLYRCTAGQQFDWHADVPFHRATGEISLLTFMVYLNAGYTGGATRFEAAKVQGEAGQALVFAHGLLHQGSPVSAGVKYALRSDVMFTSQRPPSAPADA